jgi:sporulation protein YlmC with PRC-barrel domain
MALCSAGLARGQVVTTQTTAPAPEPLRRVSQILGSTVQLNNGTGYGTVNDIVIGPENEIQYLVVSHDNQYVALPWAFGQYVPARRTIMYDVAPAALQPLIFRPSAWPNFVDPVYTRRVQTIFPGMTRRDLRRMERQSLKPVPPPLGTVVVPPR